MFDLPIYQDLLLQVENAQTSNQKGTTFETLSEYILGELEGVEVQDRDVLMAYEEIDLLLWNAKIEEVLQPWDNIILVECKNWSKPVGSAVLDNFIAKLRRRHISTGIFIAANGITGDFINGNNADRGALALLRDTLMQDGIRIVVIRYEDLQAIQDLDDFRRLIKKRYCGLYMNKVI
jgi:hypothetical protein